MIYKFSDRKSVARSETLPTQDMRYRSAFGDAVKGELCETTN